MAQAKKRKTQSKKNRKNANLAGEITGVLLIALGLLLAAFLYFSYQAVLAEWNRVVLFGLFGLGGYLLPLLCASAGVLCIVNIEFPRKSLAMGGGLCWGLLAFLELCSARVFAADAIGFFPYLGQCFQNGRALHGGGIFGGILSYPVERLLGKTGGLILLGTLVLVFLLLITRFSIREAASMLGGKLRDASASAAAARRERSERQAASIKEAARDADALYTESFPEEEVPPSPRSERLELRPRPVQQEPEPVEASVEELPPRPIRQGIRPEPQPSLEGQDTVADLYLLNRQYAKAQAFPAAEQAGAQKLQLYPAAEAGQRGSGFARARLKPRHGLKKKRTSDHRIVTPRVKDPVQQKLAETYYTASAQPAPPQEPAEGNRRIAEETFTPPEEMRDHSFFETTLRSESPEPAGEAPEEAPDATAERESVEVGDMAAAEFDAAEDAQRQTEGNASGTAGQANKETKGAATQLPAPDKKPEKVYQLPNRLDLLDDAVKTDYGKRMERENLSKALILEQALKNFNIDIKVNNIVTGPTVTRYELLPAPGVKVSRILALSNDIALNLAAPSVRIEAPIPGKAAIGIEVPNGEVAMVKIKELLDTDEFRRHKSRLYFALGKDITGKNIYGDLAKMPHLLVAGTTGSGKSVCINSIIMSILYRSSPEEVNFLMVDPKVVEMKRFNGIPHMKTAVVTDPKKATSMLNWVVNEMLKRYQEFANANVKEIDAYNRLLQEQGEKIRPKLVIVIDELADLMMASKHEVEDAICRIAQLGRAAGIHLVVATQTPRADVITGMIKTNISSRIALTVSSSLDSRIILDMNGAEDLLGNGDMLFMPIGQSKPVRLQGCYISDAENDRVIDFLKSAAYERQQDEELEKQLEAGVAAAGNAAGSEEEAPADGFEDELIPKAIELALEYEQISSSMLMRRLKIGYARAARLVDQLELKEIVSPADGNKPRQILITQEDYRRMFGKEEKE